MKIAVTGASGFVGRHVLAALASRDVEVVAARRQAERDGAASSALRFVEHDMDSPAGEYDRLGRPDVVIHLAWGGLPNYRSLHHFESELPKQYAYLRRLVEEGLPSLLVTGTCYEYGMRCGELIETLAPRPANPYAYAKSALRDQLGFLRASRHFDLTWVRLFYMYGAGQAPTSLYPQLSAAIERGDAAFKMSGGDQLRDFLPVSDVAGLIVELATACPDAGTVNICSGHPVSVRSLAERWAAERQSDIRLDFGHFPYPDYEPMAFWGSRARLDDMIAIPSQHNAARSTALR